MVWPLQRQSGKKGRGRGPSSEPPIGKEPHSIALLMEKWVWIVNVSGVNQGRERLFRMREEDKEYRTYPGRSAKNEREGKGMAIQA